MKIIYLFLVISFISVHSCESCLNFNNYNVTFNATNFEYMLHWNKHDLAPDVSFNVQYKRYGQTEWSLLHDCQNITEVNCNLTNAITSDVEHFMENQYFGRVMAFSANCTSDWVISKRLSPRDDTYLILPKLNYIQHVNSITILVSTPSVPIMGKDERPVTVEELYKNDHFKYHLNFFNPEKQDKWQKIQTDRIFEVSGLSSDREYNGTVHVSIGNDRKSEIQYFVVRTLPDYSLITLIAILIAVFVTVLGAGFLFFSCKYIKQQVRTPHSLAFKKCTTLPLMTLPKEKMISSCTVGFCPAIFMQNYEQKHQKTLRETWQEKSGNSQLQMYASQSHGASTPGQDSAGDTPKSYRPWKTILSPVSSVHYGPPPAAQAAPPSPPSPAVDPPSPPAPASPAAEPSSPPAPTSPASDPPPQPAGTPSPSPTPSPAATPSLPSTPSPAATPSLPSTPSPPSTQSPHTSPSNDAFSPASVATGSGWAISASEEEGDEPQNQIPTLQDVLDSQRRLSEAVRRHGELLEQFLAAQQQGH
ncbi:interleukin-22 receptor subunit alpha-1 isoform 1-T1 [Anomaloglossus baeobatrachus]